MTIARSAAGEDGDLRADANWGRVLCAVGYSGAEIEPDKVLLSFGGMRVLEGGLPLPFDERAASDLLNVAEVEIDADLGLGDGVATVWTCDFSETYIKINAEYRT